MIVILVITVSVFIEINNKRESKSYQISIIDSTFSPNKLKIKKEDTVIWTNLETSIQSITPDVNDDLKGNILSFEQKFNHTFHKSGIYRYHNEYNKNMSGIIIVE